MPERVSLVDSKDTRTPFIDDLDLINAGFERISRFLKLFTLFKL
jgi:hypothetical protein